MGKFTEFLGSPIAGYILLAILAIVLLVTLILFTKKGIIKDLFNIAYIGGLVALFIFVKPMLFGLLDSVGFMPATLLNMSGDVVLNILCIILILIGWGIVVAMFNAIFKKLFKYEKRITRFFGFLMGLPVAVALTLLVGICSTSPYLLKGSQKMLQSSPVMTVVDEKVLQPTKTILNKLGLPGDYEDRLISSMYELGSEEHLELKKEFYNIEILRENTETYSTEILGSRTNENVAVSAKEFNDVLECISSSKDASLKKSMVKTFESYIKMFDGETYTIGSGEKNRLINNSITYSINEEVADSILTIFVD